MMGVVSMVSGTTLKEIKDLLELVSDPKKMKEALVSLEASVNEYKDVFAKCSEASAENAKVKESLDLKKNSLDELEAQLEAKSQDLEARDKDLKERLAAIKAMEQEALKNMKESQAQKDQHENSIKAQSESMAMKLKEAAENAEIIAQKKIELEEKLEKLKQIAGM